jgi:hypothetical protein
VENQVQVEPQVRQVHQVQVENQVQVEPQVLVD